MWSMAVWFVLPPPTYLPNQGLVVVRMGKKNSASEVMVPALIYKPPDTG